MGADGHVDIWSETAIKEAFPDADDLLSNLPGMCRREIGGVAYWLAYWDTERRDAQWPYGSEWYPDSYDQTVRPWKHIWQPGKQERLRALVAWLQAHGMDWEVWT